MVGGCAINFVPSHTQVLSIEDAKSEIVKIFQEAWEKDHGFEWEDQGPPVQRYAEDILRA